MTSFNKASNWWLRMAMGVEVLAEDSVWAITRKDGLSSDLINEVYVQDDSTFWACTNAGLSRVQFTVDGTVDVTSLTMSDGLLDNDIKDLRSLMVRYGWERDLD